MKEPHVHHPVHYKPARGGHAPGYLREAFEEWVGDGADGETCEYDGQTVSVSWICGMLWNCTDIMPSEMCGELDMLPGSTYAMGVRKAKAEYLK